MTLPPPLLWCAHCRTVGAHFQVVVQSERLTVHGPRSALPHLPPAVFCWAGVVAGARGAPRGGLGAEGGSGAGPGAALGAWPYARLCAPLGSRALSSGCGCLSDVVESNPRAGHPHGSHPWLLSWVFPVTVIVGVSFPHMVGDGVP